MNHRIRRPLTVTERNAFSTSSDVVAHLLFHRGIFDETSAQDFISPDYEAGVHDPFLFKNAEKAATRIINAIEQGEKIAIYADYDADGIPGAAVFNDFFKRIDFQNYIVYIPHRHNEGFGVNENAVKELANQGVNLIITVDCGITDVGPIARAKELGMDVIVTDHHEPPAMLPDAYAIIDHKQIDCAYPDKNLCGAGTVYKLVQAILKKAKQEPQNTKHEGLKNFKDGHEKWLLDLVGIATLSDMVPLVGENRIFGYYGLEVLRKSPRKGLVRLLNKLRILQRHLTEDDIGFMITPRINAASRMGVPMDAFKLLAADNDDDAYIYAEHLDAINNERKGMVASLVKEVKKTVYERHGASVPSVIVLGNPVWRPSLLGLAANSCAEEFDRPVFLWGRDGENAIKGSCRSEGRSNVVEIMRAVPAGIFVQFGGHRHSGGFSVSNEQIHFLEQGLNDAAEKIRNTNSEIQSNLEIQNAKDSNESAADYIDMELMLDQIDARLYADINKLAPFGIGNPKPTFLFRAVKPADIRIFGKNNDHVELIFKKTSGSKLSAISFFGITEQWAKAIHIGMSIDLVASIEQSVFRGRPELRLRIVDVVYS